MRLMIRVKVGSEGWNPEMDQELKAELIINANGRINYAYSMKLS